MTEEQAQADGQAGRGGGASKTAADAGPGPATDSIAAFGSALVKAAEVKPASTADPRVSAAFALGWHMSELYEKHLPVKDRKPPDLPGLGSLKEKQQIGILIDQVQVGVNQLKDPIDQAGLDPITLTAVSALRQAESNEDAVLATHEQLLGELTAADFRLGKAYGLGRALADSCREPGDLETLKDELDPYRIANLLRWLDDLATAFPPHAANSVAKSLTRWRDALYPEEESTTAELGRWERAKLWSKRRARTVFRTWTAAGAPNKQGAAVGAAAADAGETVGALRRQGELWRALLSGEKQGTDMLEIDNYLDATKQLASRMASIVRGVVIRMPLLAGVIIVLLGAGVWLLFQGSSSQLVGGATSILAAVGLSWKGLGGALGKLVGKLEPPLWGAVLDDAIADAITLLPNNRAETRGRRQIAWAMATTGETDTPARPSPS